MLSNFHEFLRDPNGDLSSKRLVGLVGMVNVVLFSWIMVSIGKMDPSLAIYAFMGLVAGGLMGATLDHWTK